MNDMHSKTDSPLTTGGPSPETGASSQQIANERLRQFEEQEDILQYKVDGWSVWPIFRFSVFHELAGLSSARSSPAMTVPWRSRLRLTLSELSTLFNPKQSNVIVFVQSSNRAEKVGGRYKDIYFDDILPEIGPSFKIEKINNPNYLSHSRLALIPSDITTTGINLIIAGLLRTKSPGYLQDTAVMLSNLIETHLKLSSFTPERIRLRLTNFYWSKRVYSRLIKRIHPRCLLLTTAYLNNEIVAAAKEQSMTVIEFQHGHIRHHAGYSWSSYAIPYKSSMSTPDKIFLYGEYWSEEMRAYGFWDTELKTVGSLRLDQYRKISKEPGAHPLNLLLTTQNLDVDRLIDYISEFLALADGKIELQLTFKLHPQESSKVKYQNAFQSRSNVRIVSGTEAPSTFELLRDADLHLSIYSTCHYEALGLGVPTVVLPFMNYQVVLSLCKAGYASLADSPESLLEIVLHSESLQSSPVVSEYFFRPNAIENMKAELGCPKS